MDVKHINPFVESFIKVIPQIGFNKINIGKVSAKSRELTYSGVIIVVGIVGEIKGNVVYYTNLESAKKIASTMMMGMPIEEFDEMSKSALSELTNMLTANAATIFYNMGVQIDISTPTLFHGENVSVKMSSSQVLCVELFADDNPFEVNISIEK